MCALVGYFTVAELLKRNSHVLTKGGLKHYLAHRYSNGLQESGAVIRPRKKLYIHEEKFFIWYLAGNLQSLSSIR